MTWFINDLNAVLSRVLELYWACVYPRESGYNSQYAGTDINEMHVF